MNSQNICKFILPREQGQLTPREFIFESIVPHSGEELTFDANAIHLVSSGEGLFHQVGDSSPISAGTVFFSFADIPFTIENIDRLNYYYISFTGGRAEELFHRFGITPKHCVFQGYDGLLPLWRDNIVRANEENIDLLSESLILYTFSKFKKTEQKDSDAVAFVLTYLEEHFTDRGVTLASVSDAAGYNPKYLSHVFKKQFGMGFSEYLRLLRIKHAVMLIESGVTSVKNVALLSGFSDPLYFSKIFTQAVGVSPSRYQKREK